MTSFRWTGEQVRNAGLLYQNYENLPAEGARHPRR
jgi:hypothetical protein